MKWILTAIKKTIGLEVDVGDPEQPFPRTSTDRNIEAIQDGFTYNSKFTSDKYRALWCVPFYEFIHPSHQISIPAIANPFPAMLFP
jgi:hypothetical protein